MIILVYFFKFKNVNNICYIKVHATNNDAVLLTSKATELFIEKLMLKSHKIAAEHKRKTIKVYFYK